MRGIIELGQRLIKKSSNTSSKVQFLKSITNFQM
jgi:hypothetical protein